MGEARKAMDKMNEAFFVKKDLKAAAACYSPDAIGVTPDGSELKGPDEIVAYMKVFLDAFPDAKYETVYAHESDNTAVDEGRFIGTNTAPLQTPTGEAIPATNKRVDIRGCDVATVEKGLVTSHRFYFDEMNLMTQLGLVPSSPG